MIISLANLIVDHDATAVARRTQDTMLYIQSEWNKRHADTIDAASSTSFSAMNTTVICPRSRRRSLASTVMRCGMSMARWCADCCCARKCCAEIWLQTSRPTATCSARKKVMCRDRFTGLGDRRLGRFAVDEKRAGERTGGVTAPVHPTNARSAGIFKGL